MWECSTGSVFKRASTPPLNLPHPISSPPVFLTGYERASLLKRQTFIFLFTQQYSSPYLTSPVNWVDFVSELVQLTSWLWVLCRNNSGNLVIFNSSALLPYIIGTFAQIHVLSKSVSVVFPSLTNQGPSLNMGNYCYKSQQSSLGKFDYRTNKCGEMAVSLL